MSIEPLRGVWTEPRVPSADGPRRRDAALVAVIVVIAAIEMVLRPDLVWPLPSFVVAVAGATVLPWRRVHPLAATACFVGIASAIHIAAVVRDVTWEGLGTAIVVLLLPYSLGRWGSGREAIGGAAVFALPLAITAIGGGPAGDVVGGGVIVLLAGAVGIGVRYRTASHRQQLESIRSRERAELARGLHDTIAHHVSAIAVQAQAGQAVAGTDATAVAEVLAVIEEQASRTLEEMRSMVGALRDGEQAERSPQLGVHDIERLVHEHGSGPPVTVELHGALGDLRPSVDAALYRIAREAITNARRHAHHATAVAVVVIADQRDVRLTVDDDGRGGNHASASGFGLVGMAERTKLVGGTFAAGPKPDGGWNVTAVLPRLGVTR